jgi:hypothetical protein
MESGFVFRREHKKKRERDTRVRRESKNKKNLNEGDATADQEYE